MARCRVAHSYNSFIVVSRAAGVVLVVVCTVLTKNPCRQLTLLSSHVCSVSRSSTPRRRHVDRHDSSLHLVAACNRSTQRARSQPGSTTPPRYVPALLTSLPPRNLPHIHSVHRLSTRQSVS